VLALASPASLKGVLGAAAAASALGEGLRAGGASVELAPVADGGEGTADVLHAVLGGEWLGARVPDAFGAPRTARWLVLPDGTAVVENLDVDRGNARDRSAARAMMQQWLAGNRFEPELVAGVPVATRVSMPIEIIAMKKTMASRSGPAREAQALMQAKALQATTCQAALAEASKKDRTLVLDSPFGLLPAG